MKEQEQGHSAPGRIDSIRTSLARRLKSALLLILGFALAMLAITQQRAFETRGQGELYRHAIAQADDARALRDAVQELRVETLNLIDGGQGRADARNRLTDAAIASAELMNQIRSDNGAVYALISQSSEFAALDAQVDAILDISPLGASPGERQRILGFNERLSKTANGIAGVIDAQRIESLERLNNATRSWHLAVSVLGLVTIMLVIAIFYDVSRNILSPLNRVHRSLQRLADGDLAVPIERFSLNELNGLSAALETFRQHAQVSRDLAFRDPSTGLPNRHAFMERGAARLAAGQGKVMIALLDVDRFKYVNDDFGHATGDLLIAEIGRRLTAQLSPDAIVARLGGDEFGLFVPLAPGRSEAALIAEVVATMRQPHDLKGASVAVTISAGHVLVAAGTSRDALPAALNQADLALYAAKTGGRDRALAYAPEMEQAREQERLLEHDLAAAIKGEGLRMVYQPIVPIAGCDELEVEALARWDHPERGSVPPDQFIPAAERTGLMVPLGRWIIDRVLSDLSGWPKLTVSLNLSPMQLQADGFVAHLTGCCRANGIPANRVMLEVTESISMERNSRALLALELLRAAGFRIALDDFGTGYSSLSMLKAFQFDRLKLDRSLVVGLQDDLASRAIFDAAVTMARQLGAEVVAEGVSDESLVAPVLEAGCTHAQGFHYSRPIEAAEVAAFYAPRADDQAAHAA